MSCYLIRIMKHLFTPVLCLFAFLSSSLNAAAQINAYASVSSISGTTLTLSSLNQTYGSFTVGGQIIIMQMQDNVAGSNTTNTSSYGTLSTIANAGMYEVVTVTSIAGLPTSITISANRPILIILAAAAPFKSSAFRPSEHLTIPRLLQLRRWRGTERSVAS